MHEMAICQALIRQLEEVAHQNADRPVLRAHLKVGPLAGVETALLRRAFEFARHMSDYTQAARLLVDAAPITVECNDCGAVSDAGVNRLLCAECRSYRVRVVSGDELLLVRVELSDAPRERSPERFQHVQ